MTNVLRDLPRKPATTAWATYIRCHDDIGWAITEEDAARVGWEGRAHRMFLSSFYSGDFPGSFAHGALFNYVPSTGDSRISGSFASLAGLGSALATGDATLVDAAIERMRLGHALMMAWDGVPLIYMGDEIGLRNDDGYLVDPALAGDNRWAHRPWMDWQAAAARHDPGTVEGRVFAGLAHLARVRASCPSLHAGVESQPVDLGPDAVLGLLRRHPAGRMLTVYNFSDAWQRVPAAAVRRLGLRTVHEQISGFRPRADDDGRPLDAYPMPPYAAWWLLEG